MLAALDVMPAEEYAGDPDAYEDWAKRASKAFADQSRRLRDGTWPAVAQSLLRARAAELDKASGHWDKAAGARDEDDFWTHQGRAEEALTQEAQRTCSA